MGGSVCFGLDISLIREVAGDIGVERNRDFYERLMIIDREATQIMNKKSKNRPSETDQEWMASMEALERKHAAQ